MKIIATSVRVPMLERKGDQIVAFQRLTYLALKGYTIHLICFGDINNPEEVSARKILESYGISVYFIRWNKYVAAFNIFIALFKSTTPFQCALYQSEGIKSKIQDLIIKINPEALYCVMVRATINIPSFNGPLFVEMVDSLGLNLSRQLELATGFRKFIYFIEAKRIIIYEKKIAEQSNKSFVVSSIDCEFISSKNVEVLPCGVNVSSEISSYNHNSKPRIIFSGNMNYQPNIDAVMWFVSNCWPTIKKEIDQVQLTIAGNNPSKSVLSLSYSDNRIEVLGFVRSIYEEILRSSVSIAPMQSGSGMQIKILEAMACAVPVVTTKLGLADIKATPNTDLIIADSPTEFTHAILRILRSPDIRIKTGCSGHNYVRKNHDWSKLNSQFERIIRASI